MIQSNNDNLHERSSMAGLMRTKYDRDATRIGVVHVGVGAFHRAHQAIYFDDLMEATGNLNWAIAGVNLRPAQSQDINRLQQNGCEYVVKSYDPDGGLEFRQVRSHKIMLDWSVDPQKAEIIVAEPTVQLVTITVTEGGYCLSDDGQIDMDNPEIVAELNGNGSSSIYAYLRAALRSRYQTSRSPLTILCCDNLRNNGSLLEKNFYQYLMATGEDTLIRWMKESVSFPCSMVDRITPQREERHSKEVAKKFGILGDETIHCESFRQWVIGDLFVGKKPDLDLVGCEIVANVHPYEEAKIRILNGSHLALAFLAALRGYTTFDTALRDPVLDDFFDRITLQEILPSLDPTSPVDHSVYRKKVKRRFLNIYIADRIARIGMDGASKLPQFLLPTIRASFQKHVIPHLTLTSVASWYVFMRQFDACKNNIEYVDPKFPELRYLLAPGREGEFAHHADLWGDTADRYPDFSPVLQQSIKDLESGSSPYLNERQI